MKPSKSLAAHREKQLAAADHVAQVRQLAGSLAHYAKPMTPEQEEAEFLKAVLADDERTKTVTRRRR